MDKKSVQGFTLIELLVAISIITLLASIILASLNSARSKAADAKRMAEFKNIQTALQLYYDKYKRYPPSPNYFPYDHAGDFNGVVAALVSEGFLPYIPRDPKYPNASYMAWDYGAGNAAGLLIVTNLESISPTTVGPNNSCRPFINNWCASNVASTDYCLCNPY